jgi:hypothetical protein
LNKSYREKVAKLWHTVPQKAQETQIAEVRRPLTALPNMALAKRFNAAFRARSDSRPGLAIANRVNALKPGASLGRAKGESQESAFALKRQSQLMAWRQLNASRVTMPVIPASISVP